MSVASFKRQMKGRAYAALASQSLFRGGYE